MMINVINATSHDIPLLAKLNKQLIEDEKHDNPMDVNQLAERMSRFINESYRAYLFYNNQELLGYALVDINIHPYYIR